MIIFVAFTGKLINITYNMKEKILAALKAKFQGGNANVLNRIAEKLAKTVTTDEQVTTAVAGVTQELIEVMESYGDSRATEATQTATQNYEVKYGLKDGKPINNGGAAGGQQGGGTTVTTTTQPAGGVETVPAWAQQLIESNKTLSDRLNKMDGERTTATRKQQLSAVYQKLPENLRKPYERISVDALSDEEFTKLVGDVTTEVDGLVADINSKGAVFGRPTAHNGGGNNQGDALTKEQEAAIGIREGKASADGQPF